MPELPDVVAYVDALRAHVVNTRLREVRLLSPFVLRSVDPPLDAVQNQLVSEIRRIGKRIVIGFDEAVQGRGAAGVSRHSPDDRGAASVA